MINIITTESHNTGLVVTKKHKIAGKVEDRSRADQRKEVHSKNHMGLKEKRSAIDDGSKFLRIFHKFTELPTAILNIF